MRQQKGFTLIELMVVIAILAILASLAIPQYLSYMRKARVSSYAEPIARGCIMDLAAHCMENPATNTTFYAINPPVGQGSPGVNCRSTSVTTTGGTANLGIIGAVYCLSNGTLVFNNPNREGIVVRLNGITDFQARCYAQNESIRCTVEPQ